MPSNAPTPSTGTARLQRSSYPNCGRLTVLQVGITPGADPFAGLASLVHLNFPSMPEESIDLTRSVDYIVNSSITAPDGFHQYKSTNPLMIPIRFKLHFLDKEFCPQGSFSILQMMALLHSFTLPISDSHGNVGQHVTVEKARPGTPPPGNSDALENRALSANTQYNITPETGSTFAAPVTLRLDLLFTEVNKPGIVCIGYIKEVKTSLKGPFMRGPGQSYNLPSGGDFEFMFVHVPGYGNSFNIASNTPLQEATIDQAFANDVKDKLYNTVGISKSSTQGFKGFNK